MLKFSSKNANKRVFSKLVLFIIMNMPQFYLLTKALFGLLFLTLFKNQHRKYWAENRKEIIIFKSRKKGTIIGLF